MASARPIATIERVGYATRSAPGPQLAEDFRPPPSRSARPLPHTANAGKPQVPMLWHGPCHAGSMGWDNARGAGPPIQLHRYQNGRTLDFNRSLRLFSRARGDLAGRLAATLNKSLNRPCGPIVARRPLNAGRRRWKPLNPIRPRPLLELRPRHMGCLRRAGRHTLKRAGHRAKSRISDWMMRRCALIAASSSVCSMSPIKLTENSIGTDQTRS